MGSPWADFFLQHFAVYFGKPYDVESYRQEDGQALRLAIYDQAFANYRIYASVGLSEQADRLKNVGEIIILVDEFGPEVKSLFVQSLFFIVHQGIPLTTPFAIGGLELLQPGFVDNYDKSALYYTLADGFGKGFEHVHGPAGEGVVFQGIFISAAEHDFLNRKGATAFEDQFREQDFDLCSLRRPSCV